MGHKSTHANANRGYLFQGSLSPSMTASIALFTLSVLVYRILEGYSWIDCIYATIGVMSTVGIVLPPTSRVSQWFTMLLNIISLGLAATVIGEIGEKRRASARAMLRVGGGTNNNNNSTKASTLSSDALHVAVVALPTMLVSALILSYTETSWDFLDAVYVTLCSGSGLGMDGVKEPKSSTGRLVFSIYIVIQLGVMCSLLNIVGEWGRRKWQGLIISVSESGSSSSSTGGGNNNNN